ncbi:MAG: hypothetical protein PHQ28_00975 [Mycobacterium sp.]|nr:hypothetical protein [Mycobacterium sp.]
MSTPADLAEQLQHVTEREYVRFTAHWLTSASNLDEEPPLTGNRLIDALVSAASAHAAFTSTGQVPSWTGTKARVLDHFWHPAHPNLFAYSLVHSPASFALHGILIEEGSLVSV